MADDAVGIGGFTAPVELLLHFSPGEPDGDAGDHHEHSDLQPQGCVADGARHGSQRSHSKPNGSQAHGGGLHDTKNDHQSKPKQIIRYIHKLPPLLQPIIC